MIGLPKKRGRPATWRTVRRSIRAATGRDLRGNTRRRDAGSASIWLLGIGLSLAVLATAVMVAAGTAVARHRAGAAADLAALAGAARAAEGPAVACGYADQVAATNGARMVACRLTGADLVVSVEVAVTGVPRTVRASARAGPPRFLPA